MTKETIKYMNIYVPSIHKKDTSLIQNIKGKKYYLDYNEDINIDNYLHFPILLNEDGSLWKYGNLYLLHRLKTYIKPSHKTLEYICLDLKCFKEYCESSNIDYLKADRKVLRPTYKYREYLQDLFREGKISPNLLKRKMNVVVNFYKYLINNEKFKFKFKLWDSNITSISYLDTQGFLHYKDVEIIDVSKIPNTKNQDLFDDSIVDGSRLSPLEKDEQISIISALKNLANIEMTLSFTIALLTGARMQTVFTLRRVHFEKEPLPKENTIKIKVGYGTSCDTKYNKIYHLFFPIALYNMIRVYINSERANKRKLKSKHIFTDDKHQYIFLNNRGTPYYVSNIDPYRKLYKYPPNGNTVRRFILSTLNNELLKNGKKIDFSFHDLRATFGLNLLDYYMQFVKEKEISLTNILLLIKERLGHSHISTTEKYLNFRKKHKIKEMAQDSFEEYLWSLIHE